MVFIDRLWRAAKLEVNLFEEVEADSSATGQAMLVVVLGSLATGLGSLAEGGLTGLVLGIAMSLLGWAVWAWLNYYLGTRVFKEPQTHADWGQLARTMGFAYTPRLLGVLGLIPVPALRALIFLGITVWSWVAMVIAVRQALDYGSTLRAVAVTLLGFVVNVGVLVLVQVAVDSLAR